MVNPCLASDWLFIHYGPEDDKRSIYLLLTLIIKLLLLISCSSFCLVALELRASGVREYGDDKLLQACLSSVFVPCSFLNIEVNM